MLHVMIKVNSVFEGAINVTYIESNRDFNYLLEHVKELFYFDNQQSFTIKFIDDEGDPCTISSELEYNEAIRLTLDTDKEPEMTLHIFSGVPAAPGLLCPGEDKSIYRRGARRWKKLYHLNGHTFQPKRFNRITPCVYCGDQIWGLGRQGFKCLKCKLMVHKKCHKLLQMNCTDQSPTNIGSSSQSVSPEPKQSLPVRKGTGRYRKNAHRTRDASDESEDNQPQRSDELVVAENGARHYCLDDFDLLRVIGRGSYAKVLLVELKETKRRYAMKVIKKEIVAADEDIDWVQTEKHIFEIATGCDFLVGLHSCFQTLSKLFFVIEFVSGGDLMFHMQRKRRLPEDHARFYAAEISLALNYLHEKFIIYRDLKLDNVLLDQYGHIKLTDYGMCKEGIRPGETTATFCGTPNYIAPEIIKGCEYSFSIDWWAFGVLLFEMLIGQFP
ncbi:protein kinase C iota type-like isoform X2 [Panonychus citri]|uniref:protein kinase C iota type-like isoform X2 n=1 Tax=Panonychus citri TaxID=50023 RepID=UPI002307F99D|nr:protein kinase C iota type-like isoform X2 [Panonychus citri]